MVNWSSLYLPALLSTKSSEQVGQAAPESEGKRYPLASLNWLLLKFNRVNATGSMFAALTFGSPGKNVLTRVCAYPAVPRASEGRIGRVVLMIVPVDSPLRWRVPW